MKLDDAMTLAIENTNKEGFAPLPNRLRCAAEPSVDTVISRRLFYEFVFINEVKNFTFAD